MNTFDKCFDAHSLLYLNDIDYNKITDLFNLYTNKFKLSKDSVFFDVGCNAGSFVKVLQHKNIHDNIHCFEPHPVLSKTVKELYPYVTMNNYCIYNKEGTIDIYIPTLSVGLSSIIRRPVFDRLQQYINVLNTKCTTLDTYCNENDISCIDFIKIDVEGAEKGVFEGATNLLKTKKIKSGMFEVGETLTDAGTTNDEVCKILESNGYNIIKNFYDSDYFFHI